MTIFILYLASICVMHTGKKKDAWPQKLCSSLILLYVLTSIKIVRTESWLFTTSPSAAQFSPLNTTPCAATRPCRPNLRPRRHRFAEGVTYVPDIFYGEHRRAAVRELGVQKKKFTRNKTSTSVGGNGGGGLGLDLGTALPRAPRTSQIIGRAEESGREGGRARRT